MYDRSFSTLYIVMSLQLVKRCHIVVFPQFARPRVHAYLWWSYYRIRSGLHGFSFILYLNAWTCNYTYLSGQRYYVVTCHLRLTSCIMWNAFYDFRKYKSLLYDWFILMSLLIYRTIDIGYILGLVAYP